MTPLYPLQFELTGMTQSYLWGGNRLKILVSGYSQEQPLAEIWAVSDRPGDDRVSVVANGPLAGTSLHQLTKDYGAMLLGKASAVNGKFPLLLKLLDARESLSVQVHPAIQTADGEPKTEAWLLLDGTTRTATITAGLHSAASSDELRSAITNNTLQPLLHTIPVRSGDCMFVPSGRLHAIGAGCLMLEIQENSNTTYRLYDWQRVDQVTQATRPLQIEQALSSLNTSDVQPSLVTPLPLESSDGEVLIDCPQFRVERWTVEKTVTHQPTHSFEIITCISGQLTLRGASTELPLSVFSTALIPASVPGYEISGSGSYSRIFVPSTV
ncbi:MAG: type I phosphomannose isomerase catalytic subunit [Patescibacteria group bacterium]